MGEERIVQLVTKFDVNLTSYDSTQEVLTLAEAEVQYGHMKKNEIIRMDGYKFYVVIPLIAMKRGYPFGKEIMVQFLQ